MAGLRTVIQTYFSSLVGLIIGSVQEQKEVRDAKAMQEGPAMTMLKHDKPSRAASASNKRQSRVQLLTLWREAATECSSGPSKSTIVDILDVAEVVGIEK